jgi:ribonuclease P protein component
MKVVNRIKENKDFAYTIKNGQSIRADSYILHISRNTLNYVRIGISVSKKIGNAVYRNRIKRQIRAICDSLIDYSNKSFDLVIVVGRSYLDKNFEENSALLKKYLGNLL